MAIPSCKPKYVRQSNLDSLSTAIQTVNTAQASAITAIQDVNTAQASAITAIQTVNTAQASAITAIQDVNTAQASAITAIQDVNTAQASAITAIQTVNTAHDSAITAIQDVNTAQDSAIAALQSHTHNTHIVGEIRMWAGDIDTAPNGWMKCSGNELLKSQYSALYAVIGNVYGTPPSGANFFVIPAFQGRMPLGDDPFTETISAHPDAPIFRGDRGGADVHTLTTAQMPSHTHVQRGFGDNTGVQNLTPRDTTSTGDAASSTLTNPTGGGTAHNNLSPYQSVVFMIFTGVFT